MIVRVILFFFFAYSFQAFGQRPPVYYNQAKMYYENNIECPHNDLIQPLGDTSVIRRVVFCNSFTTYEFFQNSDKRMILSYRTLLNGDTLFIHSENEDPEVKGGDKELLRHIRKTIVYPKKEEYNKIEGKVIISFIVTETGAITDLKVERSAHPALDEEALRVMQSMPEWLPGRYKGVPKKFRLTIPILFKIP